MKFRFPFQNILKYRKTLENIAQRDLQEALAVLNQQSEILKNMHAEVTSARAQAFAEVQSGGHSGPALSQVAEFISGQGVRITQQQAKIQECTVKVEELQEILRHKAIDYKIIEELRDRKLQEFKIEQRKKDQKLTDDINLMRYEGTE